MFKVYFIIKQNCRVIMILILLFILLVFSLIWTTSNQSYFFRVFYLSILPLGPSSNSWTFSIFETIFSLFSRFFGLMSGFWGWCCCGWCFWYCCWFCWWCWALCGGWCWCCWRGGEVGLKIITSMKKSKVSF